MDPFATIAHPYRLVSNWAFPIACRMRALCSARRSEPRAHILDGAKAMSSTPSASIHEAVQQFRTKVRGQVVLVLQGGGALGAYQGGVYQALYESGVEPDWIIGTSIGAINAGIIVGNEPQN